MLSRDWGVGIDSVGQLARWVSVVFGSGIYYLFGSESGVDDIIIGLGGIDVATEIGWTGMQPMTDEAVITVRNAAVLDSLARAICAPEA